MKRPKAASIAIDAFYDNFTCAALFRKLRIPGSPREIVDPRPAHTFWADEAQQILAGAIAKLHVLTRLTSALRKGDFKKSTTEDKDVESFLAEWSLFIKP